MPTASHQTPISLFKNAVSRGDAQGVERVLKSMEKMRGQRDGNANAWMDLHAVVLGAVAAEPSESRGRFFEKVLDVLLTPEHVHDRPEIFLNVCLTVDPRLIGGLAKKMDALGGWTNTVFLERLPHKHFIDWTEHPDLFAIFFEHWIELKRQRGQVGLRDNAGLWVMHDESNLSFYSMLARTHPPGPHAAWMAVLNVVGREDTNLDLAAQLVKSSRLSMDEILHLALRIERMDWGPRLYSEFGRSMGVLDGLAFFANEGRAIPWSPMTVRDLYHTVNHLLALVPDTLACFGEGFDRLFLSMARRPEAKSVAPEMLSRVEQLILQRELAQDMAAKPPMGLSKKM